MPWSLAFLALGALEALAENCELHTSRSQCLAFRRQDGCAWDVAAAQCVAQRPCEARTQNQCHSELTTGAAWDDTQNQCFWDLRLQICRWSEECFQQSQETCRNAACAWRRICTPQDMSSQPGPNACFEACQVPSNEPLTGARPAPRAAVAKRLGSTQVVHTKTGPVQGNALPGVQEFLGIPFAQAPVEELRWAPSKEMSSWNQVFQATEFGAACSQQSAYYAGDSKKCQGNTRGKCLGYSEDCLTLNVWTSSTKGRKPVLLWIHGGCYVYGSASDLQYNGTWLAKQDVVLVSVQYRLGVFGFLGAAQMRTRDPSGATGNYGLQDNVAALRWVQENIEAFGGDAGKVTIFGESSGAGSVSLLMGVQGAWPYYHQTIMESGSGSFWTYITMEAANRNWQQTLSATQCSNSSVSCLVAASRALLVEAVQSVPCRDGCSWAPVLDGVFLRGTPVQLARAGQLRPNTPSISGFNKNDGAMFVTDYPGSMYFMTESSLESYFSQRFGEERKSQLQELFPVRKVGWWSKYFEAAQACETDFSYSCTAQWISTWSSPSFVYKFSQPDDQGLTLHGDEIPYIFGTLTSPSTEESQVSWWMSTYWSNFAKTGNPNGWSVPAWPSWQENASLLNISARPIVTMVPEDTWPGCSFFMKYWDFYSLCLPASSPGQRAWVV